MKAILSIDIEVDGECDLSNREVGDLIERWAWGAGNGIAVPSKEDSEDNDCILIIRGVSVELEEG